MKAEYVLVFLSANLAITWASTTIDPERPTTGYPAVSPFPGGHRRSLGEVRRLAQGELPKAVSLDNSISQWSDCPDEWHNYQGFCYKWTGEEGKSNWFASELKCRAAGGHLVSVSSKDENQIMQGITLCTNEYWLGLVNTDYVNGLFVKQNGWSWWDGSEHNYTQLTVANTAGLDCAYAKVGGKWANSYCSHVARTSICKKVSPPLALSSGIRPPMDRCPQNWVYYNDNCYFFANSTVNYFHAQLYCLDYQAKVVTVHSKQEQTFLQAVNGCEEKFWIGLERADPCVTDSSGSQSCWEWSDLSQVLYQNWKGNKPTANNNECAFSAGYWENSLPCMNKLRFICKRDAR